MFTDPQVVVLEPERVLDGAVGDMAREDDFLEKLGNLRGATREAEALDQSKVIGEMLDAARTNFEMVTHETAETAAVTTRLSTASSRSGAVEADDD